MWGFIETAEKFKKIEAMLKQNPSAKVQIPADITPEDLFGLTDDKRNKLIAAVLSTISKS